MSDIKIKKVDKGWQVSSGYIQLLFETKEGEISIIDKRSRVKWNSSKDDTRDIKLKDNRTISLKDAKKVGCKKVINKKEKLEGIEAVYSGWKVVPGLKLSFKIMIDKASNDIIVEVFGKSKDIEEVYLPRAIQVLKESGSYTVIPEGQGAIIPGNWEGEFIAPLGWSAPSMPWFGACRNGSGIMAFIETDDDYYIPIYHPRGGPSSIGIRWVSSMGSIRYPRRVRFRLMQDASYVTMAKEYRDKLIREGLFISLHEKAKSRPEIKKLHEITAILHVSSCAHDTRKMVRKVNSFDKAGKMVKEVVDKQEWNSVMVHLDGWGTRGYDNLHPDVMPPCPDAGGLEGLSLLSDSLRKQGHFLCLHDNYCDIYFDAPSFSEDLLRVNEIGKHQRIQMWAGGLDSILCAEPAFMLLKRNLIDGTRRQWEKWPGILESIKPGAYYIDNYCSSYECYSRKHRLTRKESKKGVRKLYAFLQSNGIISTCEHVTYWALPTIDMAYKLGHLKTTYLGPDKAAVGDYVGIPVPLWNLVFHDAVVHHNTHHIHQQQLNGYGTEEWHHLILFGLLNGDMPGIVLGDYLDGVTDGVFWKMCDDMKIIANVYKQVRFDQMVDHKILSSDGKRQSSRFSSGVEIEIDLAKREAAITGAKGLKDQTWILPKQ